MPKYIELSSLLERLQATSIVTGDLHDIGIMSGMDAARKIIAKQPIIDAESVVRCQYCKHHNEGENYIYCRVLKTKCPNDADFLYAYGEKESDNQYGDENWVYSRN